MGWLTLILIAFSLHGWAAATWVSPHYYWGTNAMLKRFPDPHWLWVASVLAGAASLFTGTAWLALALAR